MRVLLLGGTGAMGKHLTDLLGRDGVEVFVTSRRRRASTGTVTYIEGNARDLEFLEPLLNQRWDAIVDFMVYTTTSFRERVDLLLSATDHYVYLSSARVYADSGRPITEDSPRLLDVTKDEEYLATDEYALAKAREEDLLRHSGQRNWTIIRPYITYSEERLQLGVLEKEEWLYRALRGRSIVFSKEIACRLTTMTYGLDVASGIRAVLGSSSALGRAFHVTSGQSLRWQEVVDIYRDALEECLGSRPKVIFADTKSFLDCRPPAKYQVIYDRHFDRQFDNSAILAIASDISFKQVRDGLKECINTFLEKPEFGAINWRYEAIKDRIAHERTPLSEIDGLKPKLKYLYFRYFRKNITQPL